MKKTLTIIVTVVLALVLVAGGVKFFLDNSDDSKENNDRGKPMQTTQKPEAKGSSMLAAGRYGEYKDSDLQSSNYDQNIIFFFAPWCPECQAFKSAIQSGEIPDGTQILEADYDSSTDLRKKYGVTLQSTFVKVDAAGNLEKEWVGYGKDKSLNSVLTNLE